MTRALALAALILLAALPVAAAAGHDARCGPGTFCAAAWGAKAGSCGGAGSERNVLELAPGVGALWVETFCVRSGQYHYREVHVEWNGAGVQAELRWTAEGNACALELLADAGARIQRVEGCRGVLLPPDVPTLLP